MKRDEWDLRRAFAKEPDVCHDALMNAARSVKEEKTVKKTSMRIVLVAACILLATMTVAIAAGNLLGWTDFFGQYGTFVPDGAQRAMQDGANRHEFTLGAVRFTTQELYCDGHIAMASTHIAMAEGDALLCMEPYDPIGMTEEGEKLAQRLGVPPELTWIEAARTLGRELYIVRAILEPPTEIDAGVGMEDMLPGEDGSAVYFSMAQLTGRGQAETTDMQMYLRVEQIDPQTEESLGAKTDRQTLTLRMEPPMDTAIFRSGEATRDGYVLEDVRAELTGAGLYLYATFTAPEGTTQKDVAERAFPTWLDAQGNELPVGLSLSGEVDAQQLPKITIMEMVSAQEIPDRLMIRLPDACGDPWYWETTLEKSGDKAD